MLTNLLRDLIEGATDVGAGRRWLKNLSSTRIPVSLDWLSMLANALASRMANGPRAIVLTNGSPGLRMSATVDLFGTRLRSSAILRFDSVVLTSRTMRIGLALRDISLRLLDETTESPVATLIRSGVLDFSHPGALISRMPFRPPVLDGGENDLVWIDLAKAQVLTRRPYLAPLLSALLSILTIDEIDVVSQDLRINLRYFGEGLRPVSSALKRAFEGRVPI
jgi:hypothetical protein